MCPHGYHHSGSMATPALGTRDVRLHIVWIALWSHQIYISTKINSVTFVMDAY